jgi:hypothetical protein
LHAGNSVPSSLLPSFSHFLLSLLSKILCIADPSSPVECFLALGIQPLERALAVCSSRDQLTIRSLRHHCRYLDSENTREGFITSGMDIQNHQEPAGGQHYSGRNRVPNIQQFVEQLDREKKDRDAAIDEDLKRNKNSQEITTPKKSKPTKKNGRKVRDPVTGKDVEIRDCELDFETAVENPQLSVPNENLGKPSTATVSHTQSGEEYRQAQDIVAPPEVLEGATSDVPIRSEKTSILFYKTPSVSYEPMFEALELRGNILAIGIFFGIIFFGRMFGGRLLGLIPLAICVSSGVFLWVKDLIRRGRDHEWSSEQQRGETATANLIPESVEWMNTALGLVWGMVNPEMFAGVADT